MATTPVFLPGKPHGQRSLVAIVLVVGKSRTGLSTYTHTHTHTCTHAHTHTHTEFQIIAKVVYSLQLAWLWYETAVHTAVSNSHFLVLFLPALYWVHIFYFSPPCIWRFLVIDLEVSLWNDVLQIWTYDHFSFERKLCSNWYVLHFLYVTIMIFSLLSSSHSLMKILNKTGLWKGPQGPSTSYVPSGLIAVYHDFFFFPTHSSAVFNSCDSAPMQVNLN